MNNQYLFEAKTIGVFEHNIDLLRNRYVYDKIEYRDVNSAKIENGLPKNWFVQLALGLIMILFSILVVLYVHKISSSGEFINNLLTFWRGSRGTGLMAILFLLFFGIYIIINSLKKSLKLTIETFSFSKTFDIREIDKKQLTDSLIEFLGERIETVIDKRITQPNTRYISFG